MRILHPDRGDDPRPGRATSLGAANDRVGYLPEERGPVQADEGPRGPALLRRAQGLPGRRPAIDAWLDRMGLADWADKKVEALSKGMSQKVQFIATVIARPRAGPARRAVQRPRPGQRRGAARGDPRPAPRRHHGHLLDARHGRRREDVRLHLHDLPGQEGPRRHAGVDPGRLRQRHACASASTATASARRPARRASRSTDFGQLPGAAAEPRGRPAATAAPADASAARCATSSWRGRRCTTSSSGSPRPEADGGRPCVRSWSSRSGSTSPPCGPRRSSSACCSCRC